MAANKERFKEMTRLVIDKLEGGYFHPNMRTANPTKFGPYHRSGETMFGLDRHAGHDLYYSTPRKSSDVLTNLKYIDTNSYTYKTPEAKEFWTTIDKIGAKNSWNWNYKGGDLNSRLKDLTVEIMFPVYERNAKNYLTPQAKEIVDNDNRLLFHFIYASWNGPGWFQKFAKDINKAVASDITDSDKLAKIAISSRTEEGLKEGSPPNSLIAQGGRKISTMFETLKTATAKSVTEIKKKPLLTIVITAIVVISVYNIYKLIKKK